MLKKSLGLVGMYLLISAMFGFGYWLANEKSVKITNTANAEFDRKLQEAKIMTSNPCGLHHMELVQPPQHSTREAVLVIGGHALSESSFSMLNFQAVEPVPGEKVVRVVYTPKAPEYQELIFIAHGTKACDAGYQDQIKQYAIFCGRGGCTRPPWPVPGRVEK